jgi:hypothetical protein
MHIRGDREEMGLGGLSGQHSQTQSNFLPDVEHQAILKERKGCPPDGGDVGSALGLT